MASITTGITGIKDQVWDIRYTTEKQDGFFLVSDQEDVTHNCKNLEIDMDSDDQWGPHHFKAFDSFFVYTSQVGGKPYQYIVTNAASEGDIIEFAAKKPKKIAQQIFQRLGLV